MVVKTDYDREFIFDIDAYLISSYPKMTMAIRRSVCTMALAELGSDFLEEVVDECVAEYAQTKLEILKKADDDDEDEDEE
jgi:hypothetical protein